MLCQKNHNRHSYWNHELSLFGRFLQHKQKKLLKLNKFYKRIHIQLCNTARMMKINKIKVFLEKRKLNKLGLKLPDKII